MDNKGLIAEVQRNQLFGTQEMHYIIFVYYTLFRYSFSDIQCLASLHLNKIFASVRHEQEIRITSK